MRLPLATDLKTRTGAPDKDARLKNCYVESKGPANDPNNPPQTAIRRRPSARGGIQVGTGIAQGGINGLFVYGDVLYPVTQAMLTTCNNATNYSTGDHVTVNMVDYWATTNHIGNCPIGSGNSDWSASFVSAVFTPSTFTKFVAVGNTTTVYSSTNGLSWSSSSTMPSGTWNRIAHSSTLNLWCAVGNFYIATSIDAITWTIRFTDSNILFYDVKWISSLGLFVASCGDNLFPSNRGIYTSPDGINWTQRNTAFSGLTELCYALGKIYSWESNRLFSSVDGINWSYVTFASLPGMTSIIYGGGLFVASSNDQFVYTSTDGSAWTQRTTPVDIVGTTSELAYSPSLSLYVKINNQTFAGGTVSSAYSSDSITWNAGNLPAYNRHFQVIWNPDNALFVSNRGYVSSDGATWTLPSILNAYGLTTD